MNRRLRIEPLEQRTLLSASSVSEIPRLDLAAAFGAVDPGSRPQVISEQEWGAAEALPTQGTLIFHTAWNHLQEMSVKLRDFRDALLGYMGEWVGAYAWRTLRPLCTGAAI